MDCVIESNGSQIRVTQKPNKVIYKYYEDEKFLRSAVIPTVLYPLPSDNLEVFTAENTEPITDKALLDLIDTVPFKVGHCYSTARGLYDVLTKNGYSCTTYEGWLGLVGAERLIHHCFLKVGEKHIVETSMSDDFTDEYMKRVIESGSNSNGSNRLILADLTEERKNWKNSQNNPHIGRLAKNIVITGVPNTPESAVNNYNHLMDTYRSKHPDYDGKNGYSRHGNLLNYIIADRGIYDKKRGIK